jgi:hypothetical protein
MPRYIPSFRARRPLAASRALAIVASLAIWAGCADDRATPTSAGKGSFPASMQIAGGDAQAGVVGAELPTPLTVKVVDARGAALVGQVVNFRVVSGGGSVFAGAAVTDAQGRAAERWTLGPRAGEAQSVEVRAVDPVTGAPKVFATFAATARADRAASLEKAAPDSQTAAPGKPVTAPTVRVRDRFGNPVRGATVTFAIGSGRGQLGETSVASDSDGVASAKSWTLGPGAGTNTVLASTDGASSLAFTAFASQSGPALPEWTVMVYMAADNNLAIAGVKDIEEMEAAGPDPDVNVVVQAEFSPSEFAQRNCDASCAHLQNFNTFRYAITGGHPSVTGPDGPVTDIGNRNMVDPNELREFITWAKANYPAERYAVVLWNHGGGYTGLLEDVTSGGEHLMSIGDLPKALSGVGPIDLLDFDMCLMGGYETLAQIRGLAKYAVFSEEVVPGDGNPYTEIIKALQADPSMSTRDAAKSVVDLFHASYARDRASTTVSAYDLDGFAEFESALETVASSLTANLGALRSAIGASAVKTQRYEIPALTDMGDLVDSLRAHVSDPTLLSQLSALQAKLNAASFRIDSRARTGAGNGASSVTRSTGLSILMPSGSAADLLPNQGPGSFEEYRKLYASKGWTKFLAAWLGGATTANFYDQGSHRFESYLVWDSTALARGADLDFVILEPDGNLRVPFLGTVTPNGHLSPDSHDSGSPLEGYLTNQFVLRGQYKLYALLYDDPQNVQPQYDLLYRFAQTDQFQSLFSPQYPRLSFTTSWLDDAGATIEKIEADAYTDFRYMGYANIGTTAGATVASVAPRGRAGAAAAASTLRADPGAAGITRQQFETIRRNWRTIRSRARSAGAARALVAPRSLPRLAPSAR